MRPVTTDRKARRGENKAIGDEDGPQNPYASMYQQAFGASVFKSDHK